MRQKAFYFFLVFSSMTQWVHSQSAFVPYESNYYHQLERLEIKSGKLSNDYHVNIKPFERKKIADFLSSLDSDSLGLSKVDQWNLNYLKQDNWEWMEEPISENQKPFLKTFFKQKSDFYHFKNKGFNIHVNPIFHFSGGSNSFSNKNEGQYNNTRGIAIRGAIGKKLGFSTFFTENQSTTPFYIKDYHNQYNGFPYIGFHKLIDGDSLKLAKDYMQAGGYFVFRPSKYIMLRFGHSTNFIGSGVRSMILSDFSAPYLHLATEVNLGRMQYMNILARMSNAQVDIGVDDLQSIPAKYMVFHHLNFNITKNLNVGLFETIMFGNNDFDLNYLNPVILYRFVESFVGSADNAIVGLDFKWNIFKTASLYGQLVLDEFNTQEIEEEGWGGKKNSGQIGIKYIDFLGLKQFDFQFEYNYARPYTYSHFTSYSNVVNYNAHISHPAGANFREFIFLASYQPTPKLFLKATYMNYMKGFDTGEENWGGDIFKNYRYNIPKDVDFHIGQGEKRWTSLFKLEASYMLAHNLFVDTSYQIRNVKTEESQLSKSSLFNVGVRWNAFNKTPLF